MSRRATFDLRSGDALVMIDVQRDFLPGGALAVPGGDAVLGPLGAYLRIFEARRLPVFATRDWHPPDHCSFVAQGGTWPAHCVRDTPGAAFAPALQLPADVHVVSKATSPSREAYSDFSADSFAAQLQEQRIRRLFVGGLATEYCVLATVRDARERGYEVVLLLDAIRAIDPAAGRQAIDAMQRLGVVGARLADFEERG